MHCFREKSRKYSADFTGPDEKRGKMKKALMKTVGLAAAAGLFMAAPGRVPKKSYKPFLCRNIAHRGLHTEDKSVPENSLAAFRAAAEAGYGIELDLQLSKDGQVVVFHDETLERVCDEIGRVEDLDYRELSALRLCHTEEKIPLFSEVLYLVRGRVPMIVELKTSSRNEELCRKTWQLLRDYQGDYCIESFDPRILGWFRLFAPQVVRGQLACPYEYYDEETSPLGRFLLSNCMGNFVGRPHFIAYRVGKKPIPVRLAEKLGDARVCWTSHDPDNEKDNDTVIFEFYRPEIRY